MSRDIIIPKKKHLSAQVISRCKDQTQSNPGGLPETSAGWGETLVGWDEISEGPRWGGVRPLVRWDETSGEVG